MGELLCAAFTQCLLIFNHVAFLVPGLLSTFIKLNFEVSLIIFLVLQFVVVAHQKVLIVKSVTFTNLLDKVLEVRLADDFLRVS